MKKRRKNDQTGTQARLAAPPLSTSKVSLDGFDQGGVQWTIASMYYLNVLPTLDNIRTELKQSIIYTGSKGRLDDP